MNWSVLLTITALITWLGLISPAMAQGPACEAVFLDSTAQEYLNSQIETFASARRRTHIKTTTKSFEVTSATRNFLLNEVLYKERIVEASDFSRLMSDKLFQVEFLKKVSPGIEKFFPKTESFREFLKAAGIQNEQGQILKNATTPEQVLAALEKHYPQGFVVKPTAGYNTGGRGFYINDAKALVHDLINEPTKFLGADKNFLFKSDELGLASGEGFLIQEMLSPAGGGRPPEYRVHTFEGRVVEGATESRWLNPQERNFKQMENFVQNFLSRLPKEATARQAWGLDVVEVSPGNYRIIEINTNRGHEIQWSGYLISSFQLGALTRHLEKHGVLKLTGPLAETFRKNKAGLEAWIRKEGYETVIEDLKINDPELAYELLQQKP
ncbi:hypothetical protein [Bdellovibrio bacteriovorus]|uniref:hypothetical protein n=1 Tax=Bdellovibrio bacteriovorus TaxID=959 RepID=UPI0035A81B50